MLYIHIALSKRKKTDLFFEDRITLETAHQTNALKTYTALNGPLYINFTWLGINNHPG